MKNNDIQEITNIFVPIIILGIGIFGLFSEKIPPEQAQQLIFAGGLSTGLSFHQK